ncbi:MAG: SDR family oxidoreductase [Edaphobacter sp.]|jgi:NAD(P)-dependent dehydrogenase (short-subunit alcohol dehydrogenase family)
MSSENGRLAGMTCVIGGAASAIGRAVAERLVSEGAIVVGLDAVEHSTGSISITTDLSDEQSVRETFARIHQETGRIDFLYNNAGLVTPEDKSVLETTSEVLERVWSANFRTAWLCCKYGIPYMLQNNPPSGSVVNCSSFLAGMGSATGQMSYNAAKAAVAQMSRDLGTNLARQGVRVNALCLGPIETPALTEVFTRIGEEERRRRFVHMPLGRFGTLEQIAGTVAFLASSDSGFITASVFPLDGGIQNAFTVPD